MIEHLDAYSYLYTVGFILVITLTLNFTNGRLWVIKHQASIAYLFAFMQFALFIGTFAYRVSYLSWWDTLLHDLCPALSYFSVIIFIWNKEKLYKAVMPWFIIGSLITMLAGGSEPIFTNPSHLTSYLEHTFMIMQGILAYFWVSEYSKKELGSLLIFPAISILWNLVTGLLPWQLTGNDLWAYYSTGLFRPSVEPWTSFAILGSISWVPYPLSTIIFYAISVGLAILIASNKKYYPRYKRKIINLFNDNQGDKIKRQSEQGIYK